MRKILVVILLFTAMAFISQEQFALTAGATEDLVIPDYYDTANWAVSESEVRTIRIPEYGGDCCCEASNYLLNQVYQNQLQEKARNSPSTLNEIKETYYKLSK